MAITSLPAQTFNADSLLDTISGAVSKARAASLASVSAGLGLIVGGKLPLLYADFGANNYLSRDMTITRNSAATFIDGTGKIQTAAINTPRYDWRTGRRGLLIGAGTTNLCKLSEDFSQSPWGNSGAVPVAPLPLGNGLMGVATAGYPNHGIYDEIALNWIIPPSARPAPDSTGRASVTFTAPAGCTSIRIHPLRNSDNSSFIRQAIAVTQGATYTLSWYERGGVLGGVQLETGPIATAYIPSGAVAGTRAADVASFSLEGIDLSGGYTVMASYRFSGHIGPFDRVLQLDSGATDTTQHIRHTSTTLNMGAFINAAGQLEASGSLGAGYGATETTGFAVGPNMFQSVSRSGGAGALDTTVNYVAPNTLRLGSDVSGRQPAQLTIFKLALWAQPMSSGDLQAAWGAIQ